MNIKIVFSHFYPRDYIQRKFETSYNTVKSWKLAPEWHMPEQQYSKWACMKILLIVWTKYVLSSQGNANFTNLHTYTWSRCWHHKYLRHMNEVISSAGHSTGIKFTWFWTTEKVFKRRSIYYMYGKNNECTVLTITRS